MGYINSFFCDRLVSCHEERERESYMYRVTVFGSQVTSTDVPYLKETVHVRNKGGSDATDIQRMKVSDKHFSLVLSLTGQREVSSGFQVRFVVTVRYIGAYNKGNQ